MNIEKLEILSLTQNRASIILSHNDYIIIDYYVGKNGLSLYSNFLELKKNIYFIKDIIFNRVYKGSKDQPFILVFSFDYDFEKSEIKILLVDLRNFSYVYKDISQFQDLYFTSIYVWNNKEIIILSTDGDYYLIITVEKDLSIQKIDSTYKKEIYQEFYEFAEVSKHFEVKKCYPEKLQFTFLDTENNQAGIYDFSTNSTKTIKFSYPEDNYLLKPFDVIYKNGFFILTSYHRLYIYKDDKMINVIEKYEKFRFYETMFLENSKNEFAVVCSDPLVMPGSAILKYKIEA